MNLFPYLIIRAVEIKLSKIEKKNHESHLLLILLVSLMVKYTSIKSIHILQFSRKENVILHIFHSHGKIYLNTTLAMVFCIAPCLSKISIFGHLWLVTHNTTTYSWPCMTENKSVEIKTYIIQRFSPTLVNGHCKWH